ncbi:response regulator [Spirosoma pollinicola]|uniref:Response regulator n=2 Tax=Spirosoma pollinicola TaxID=2057025 RepID=A0A2K8ZCL3_9BACT|nr:response regulator [Spirosoma pollinicola]
MIPATADRDDQYFFEQALKTLVPSMTIRALYDGEELLAALEQCETVPNLILLDLHMPQVNGFDALAQVRSEVHLKELPVVVLSTSSTEQDRQRALQLGADGFLTKPPILDQISSLFGTFVKEWQLITVTIRF